MSTPTVAVLLTRSLAHDVCAEQLEPPHGVLTHRLHAHLRWRNTHARSPDLLAAQCRERARVRAALTYVDWFNQRRLHGEITNGPGYTTPAAVEADHYRQAVAASEAATQ